MSRIVTNGLMDSRTFAEFSTFPSSKDRGSLGESMNSSCSSEYKSLSSTITSLDDVEFFRKDSLFSDSDGGVQDDCHQELDLKDQILDVFEEGNNHLSLQARERQIDSTANELTTNKETCSSLVENTIPHQQPRNHNSVQPLTCAVSDMRVDEFDAGTPLRRKDRLYYDTFCDCCENRADGLTNQPCCSNFHTQIAETEERRSAVNFMLTPEYSENGGMNLYSHKKGHFIEVVDKNSKYPSRMSFQHNDRILGINYQAIHSYEHDIVSEMFRYLLHPPTEELISLVLEREDESGEMIVLEISIRAEVITRGNPAIIITAEINYSKPVRLNIKCVVMKNCHDLRIQGGGISNVFAIADKGGLCVRHLKDGDENKSVFKYYIYNGLCMTSGRRAKSIFFAVFQSCHNHKFIMAPSRSKLSLINARGKLDTSVGRITKADPRFFIIHKSGDDETYCESLLFRGSYWSLTGRGLQLAKRTETEVLMRNDSMFKFIAV